MALESMFDPVGVAVNGGLAKTLNGVGITGVVTAVGVAAAIVAVGVCVAGSGGGTSVGATVISGVVVVVGVADWASFEHAVKIVKKLTMPSTSRIPNFSCDRPRSRNPNCGFAPLIADSRDREFNNENSSNRIKCLMIGKTVLRDQRARSSERHRVLTKIID